ncbi:Serine/Threonine kinase (macronuclear) [Tetrahymena thermophila SB210]|uniref:Serine/Threonine kinase n=1 Tax=Tetrahymena thermophila (strain SB210) TaxID=312017 RepID=Q22DA5_TETTS|nr:Serine/Threonine kinase [Tetrahymena thermophila SB210]EAR83297.2 Serine/Threonine kinase [Tetrahymena thermophila SB210]|eukprot:XP_001030960.2 Serine/Threonine kinase [Tetrahymena thermophila SB210]
MSQQVQVEAQAQNSSIKFNLTKEFFDLEKKKTEIEDEISSLRRKINKAITYQNLEDKKLFQDQKSQKENEANQVDNDLESYIKKLLNELKNSKNKWLLQCYKDKISSFSKDIFINASKELELQYKDNTKDIIIARPESHGKTIAELIEISRNESKTSNQPNNQQELNLLAQNQNSQQIQIAPNNENPEAVDSQKNQQKNKSSSQKVQESSNKSNNTKAKNTDSNKSSSNTNNKKNKNKVAANKQEEEEDLADIIKKQFETKEIKKDKKEILQEVEEEQKDMTKEEIMQSLYLPAESVKGYEIIKMSNNYVLELKVHEPDQNSFPIQTYKVYLIKEKKKNTDIEISDEQLKNKICLGEIYQTIEKQFLCSSKSSTIEIDLKQVCQSYILGFDEETSYFQIAITALSWKNESPDDYLESQITHIFRLNMPKIIQKKTRLLLTGSCELIYTDYFSDCDLFQSNYSQSQQALKKFLSPDSELFKQIEIQSIDFGKSALILLKNGQVIQWGNILCFNEGISECNIDKLKEETSKELINQPFMPVQHPLVFTKIAQGKSHYVGVTIDGKVYSWGKNKYGQLGHQNYISYVEPKRIDHLHSDKIFIVNVQCGDNFTVCQSCDGTIYTFGQKQALQGEPIKDLYNNTINMCNLGVNQLIPRKIDFDEKIISFSCGKDHCLFITEKNTCYGWGDNYGSKICSSTYYKEVRNFANPIPVIPNNSSNYSFKKIFCSDTQNCAIMQNKTSGEQILIKWGGNTTLPFDVQACKINLSLPKDQNEELSSLTQKPQLVTKFDKFYTNTYSSLLIQNNNNNIKLYVNGQNIFYSLGVRDKEIKNFQMAAISPCEDILQASIGCNHTTALLVV